ncbi:hypothetical protein [Roseateles toxinivorans]|uniref:Uncharacterized protein n=1 Tax=Roseateles toxinivorans TaxID=270368 RepID=A0A4R6QJ96_9BURK|nr:hypothetical protein [Roseateles toxinivorans]TDP63151.1 hypothetical protein DES47_105152 [Roseateles toxinivorans]
MATRQKARRSTRVIPFPARRSGALDRHRSDQVRQWLIDKAMADEPPISALTIVLQAENVDIAGIGLEPELCSIFIDELTSAIKMLEDRVRQAAALPSNVVRFQHGRRHHG